MIRFSFLLYFTILLFMNGAAQAASPYPPSPVIEKVTWDFNNLIEITHSAHFSADLWPMTWGPDNNLYTSWGDGLGFQSADSGLGFARISGGPTDWVGTDLWRVPRPGGKVEGMLSVNGVLYGWKGMQDDPNFPKYRLTFSTDLGLSWKESTWSFNSSVFVPATFLNFGRDYAGARDNFVYAYGGAWGRVDDVYMTRVPKADIMDQTKYEYYSGDQAGNPAWTRDINSRKPVFTDVDLSNGNNNGVHHAMTYNPIIRRYLLTIPHGTAGTFGLFDAPEPWGPWTTVEYAYNWGGYPNNVGEALHYNFVNKWTSADGLTMWLVFSGAPPDGYHQVKATLKLKQPSVDTTAPAIPIGLEIK